MAVDSEMLKRIMGMPDSVTGKLVAMRRTPTEAPLETGVWYSNFTRVKTEAEQRGLPFFAMWTNGDLCGFCRRFTNNVLQEPFYAWMRHVKGLFWLGGSMDDNEEDKRGGVGFQWCRGPEQKVSYFPFVTFAQFVGGVYKYRFHGSGHDFDDAKAYPEGTSVILIRTHNIADPGNPIEVPDLNKMLAERKSASTTNPPLKLAPSTPSTGSSSGSAGRLSIRFNSKWDDGHILRFQTSVKEHGGYCPCRADRNADTKCMCKDFLALDKPGICRCGVFEKYYA